MRVIAKREPKNFINGLLINKSREIFRAGKVFVPAYLIIS